MNFREERARDRKNEILKAATKAFREKGFHDTTLEEIASELKYTKGSIYYYVSGKEELLFECHQRGMDVLINKIKPIARLNESPEKKLIKIIKKHVLIINDEFTVVVQHAPFFEPKLKSRILDKRDEYERLIEGVIKEGIEKKVFKKDVNPKVVVFLILGASNWIPQWFNKGGTFSIDEIAEFYAHYLCEPLLA